MTKHEIIAAGLIVGAAVAVIYVLDKNRATLGAAIDRFGNVDLTDIFTPAVMGNVIEGDPDDFTVVGTFGEVTRAQQIRNKPDKV